MRTKTIIPGLKNSQRFRFMLSQPGGTTFGMYTTVTQAEWDFATTQTREAVITTLKQLVDLRNEAGKESKTLPTGLLRDHGAVRVQVDLCE